MHWNTQEHSRTPLANQHVPHLTHKSPKSPISFKTINITQIGLASLKDPASSSPLGLGLIKLRLEHAFDNEQAQPSLTNAT